MLYNLGDVVTTKKSHPCGGKTWTIVRVGADIKIKCNTCGHVVMLGLDTFPKAITSHLPKAD